MNYRRKTLLIAVAWLTLNVQANDISSVPFLPVAASEPFKTPNVVHKAAANQPPDDGSFQPERWKHGVGPAVPRLSNFNRFLKQYNIIGMNQDKVLELLGCGGVGLFGGPGIEYIGYNGDVKTLRYWLDSSGCTGPNTQICIHFDHGTVSSWNFSDRNGQESQPITTNVVISNSDRSERVPSGFALSNIEKWPETTAK
jgi:hypothetical protein